MKFLKFITLILLISMLTCTFVACQSKKDNGEDIPTSEPCPTGETSEGLTEVDVTFYVRNAKTGEYLYRAENYRYKGFNPTVFGVIHDYMTIENDNYFKVVEGTHIISTMGDLRAEEGQYWYAFKGTKFVDIRGNEISVKKISDIYSKESLSGEDANLKSYMDEEYLIPALNEHILSKENTAAENSFTILLCG